MALVQCRKNPVENIDLKDGYILSTQNGRVIISIMSPVGACLPYKTAIITLKSNNRNNFVNFLVDVSFFPDVFFHPSPGMTSVLLTFASDITLETMKNFFTIGREGQPPALTHPSQVMFF